MLPDSSSNWHARNEAGCRESSVPFPRSIFSLPSLTAAVTTLLAQAQLSLLQRLPTPSLIGRLQEARGDTLPILLGASLQEAGQGEESRSPWETRAGEPGGGRLVAS